MIIRTLLGVASLCGALSATAVTWAQGPPASPLPSAPEAILPPVTVTAPPPLASSSEQIIPGRDFELRPQGRPADVLRLIPGLIINQHQGGGKAEQYLIRGFDADHGTDLAIFVDGVPVNLRSHAHGQGYADLHFLIPETIRAVDVLKGPYFPEYGDFATAGVVKFTTRDFVEENTLEIAGGSFNTQRYLALLSPTRDAVKTFIAIEGYRNDGPFEHPNGYLRFNLFAKATTNLSEDMRLSVWGSHYRAEWHGSGEIPARAVRAGLIDRFGAIDANEGGVTERTNLNLDYLWKVTDNQRLSINAYVSYYRLDPVQRLHVLPERPGQRRHDQPARPAVRRRARRAVRDQEPAVRDPADLDGRRAVPHRHAARRARQRRAAAPGEPDPGRGHRRAVLLAVREARSGPDRQGAPGHRRPRRRLLVRRPPEREHHGRTARTARSPGLAPT